MAIFKKYNFFGQPCVALYSGNQVFAYHPIIFRSCDI